VARLTGRGAVELPFPGRLRGITVLAGEVTLGGVTIAAGRSGVAPACFAEESVQLTDAHAIVTAIA
jgi:hypothetical protein